MHFNAKWINYETGEYQGIEARYGNPAPYFRKTFSCKGKVKKAQILASALGVYKIYVNGQAISDDYFSPGWVDYNKKLPFVRFDITGFLGERNAVGIVLGDGWAVGHVGSNATFKRTSYSDKIYLCAQIVLEYENGETERINTDESWLCTQGEIRRTDIYMGEYVDHRLSLGDFSAVDYDDSEWEHPTEDPFRFPRNIYLEEMKLPPIRVKHTFIPALIKKEGNQLTYDVSQNIAGALRLTFRGKAGAKVTVRHGELFVDGKIYTENLRKAEATDVYILAGEEKEIFRPLFTFHGFRYAELELEGEVEILDIVAEAMYTDLPVSGEFSCSNSLVNRIYQNALWSQRDNFLGVPTDCPQRDERLGWTADAQIFSQSAMYNMACKEFYEKYLTDVREAQLGNGVVPAVAPLPHIGFYNYVGFGPSAGWCEAIAEIPFCHYRTYGDRMIIRDNLYAIKKMLDYFESTCPDGIRRTCGKTYGDWLSLGNETDKDMLSTLFYGHSAYICAELCRAVGDFETARYEALYEKIKKAFAETFVAKDGTIQSDTQSCYVIAYKFGFISKASAREHLERKFREDGGKLTCGFLGVRFLLPTLCDVGLSEIAYRLITSEEYPGWGYSVVNGATTIWEHWDSFTQERGIRDGMNSFNHYSFGSCTEWMYEYVLGIRSHIESPGFEKISFIPYFCHDGSITSARGYYDSAKGRIDVEWRREGEKFIYNVTSPEEAECFFEFPEMKVLDEKKDGNTYRFELVRA
ncbi:MAG: alpha-L-rhamnosidase [Ruminococcaceae bacterium]|nr:alpha-L-rhamnosidase [Oscillospiraceae bacterium]